MYQDIQALSQEAYDFLKTCLEPDLRESCMENANYSEYSRGWTAEYCGINIEICFREEQYDHKSVNRYYFFSVSADAARILAYAAERGIEPTVMEAVG